MDRLAASSSIHGGLSRRLPWVLGIVLAVVVCVIVVLYLGRIKAVYQLYWGSDQLHRLFYEDIGLSDAWSSVISLVSFFFAVAWLPLSLWSWRLLGWRFSFRQAATAFGCWVLIYGTVPLAHALLGSDTCFNQRTGEALKWYVVGADGRIILFDSSGYDTVRAIPKLPVTPEICSAFARQKVNGRPHQIAADIHSIEFFDPNNGRPQVWYHRDSDGNLVLFDASGFDPSSGDKLLQVTQEAVAEIKARAAKGAEEVRQRAAKEAEDRAARAAQAARKAEAARQAEIMRMQAKEAQAKVDADRKAGADKLAEAELLRAARAAQAKAEADRAAQVARQTAATATVAEPSAYELVVRTDEQGRKYVCSGPMSFVQAARLAQQGIYSKTYGEECW